MMGALPMFFGSLFSRVLVLALFLAAAAMGFTSAPHAQLLTGYGMDESGRETAYDFRQAAVEYRTEREVRAENVRREAPVPVSTTMFAGSDMLPADEPENTGSAEQGPVDLVADNLEHDEKAQMITASGNVELVQGGRILRADYVSYNLEIGDVVAHGDVVLTEPNGDVHFAEEVRLSNEMRQGFVRSLRSYLSDGGQFTAAEGEQHDSGMLVTMRDATYTPCDCDVSARGYPVWQITADEVTYDKERHHISYRNARFEIYGVPVAYTPYLAHSDGRVARQSGFLIPDFGYNSRLGFNTTPRYYYDIAPHRDATFGLMLTTETLPVAQAEYRHRFENARLQIEGSATHAQRLDLVADETVTTGKRFRGHLFSQGQWDINERWRSGYNLELTTDDEYLRRYGFSSKDVLENELYAERFSGRHYAAGRLLSFQDVRIIEKRVDQPNVLPELVASFVGEPNATLGGRWNFDASLLGLQRYNGQDMTRISAQGGWQKRVITGFGLVNTLDLMTRGDVYAVNNRDVATDDPGRSKRGTATRLFSRAHLESSYPLVKPLERAQIVVEPTVALTLAPPVKTSDGDIPNEDSLDVQLDAGNLFRPNRFSGRDRIEDRSRVTYGARTGLYGHDGSYGDVFLGQSMNLSKKDTQFPKGSGLSGRRSDYVGQISGSYKNRHGLNYRFQLSDNDLSSRRHELDAYATWRRFYINTRYLYAQGFDGDSEIETREQIEGDAAYRLSRNWQIRGGALRDMGGEDPGLRYASFGLDYLGCCMSFSATARRKLTADASGDGGTDVTFRVGLKGLGGFQSEDTGFYTAGGR